MAGETDINQAIVRMMKLGPSVYRYAAELETKNKQLRAALLEIKTDCGRVCPEFELCDHPACASSYAAWQIADVALGKEVEA